MVTTLLLRATWPYKSYRKLVGVLNMDSRGHSRLLDSLQPRPPLASVYEIESTTQNRPTSVDYTKSRDDLEMCAKPQLVGVMDNVQLWRHGS
jgi:hypothetical protein